MCGILGGWLNYPLESSAIEDALERMHHRGPDSFGVWQDGNSFLGMRRLAVIDLETGRQPLFNETNDVIVVCNGEIYNYRELCSELRQRGHDLRTKSDVESVVHLYEDHGVDCVKRLRGMFGLAIMDRRERTLRLARDRFGKKPIYYYFSRDLGLLFGSEIKALKALIELCDHRVSVSDEAVYDYLSLGVVPQPGSIYSEIRALGAGSTLSFDGEEPVEVKYWPPEKLGQFTGDYFEAQDEVRRLIKESVEIRLRSDVPLGVFLSGGVDSTVVAFEAAKILGGNLDSFTVKASSQTLDESGVAARTAKELGIRNQGLEIDVNPVELLEKVVAHYDQPFADPSAMPSLAISRAARKHVTVVLNGDGGDELFGGYRRYLASRRMEYLEFIPSQVWRLVEKMLGPLSPVRRSRLGFLKRVVGGLGRSWGSRYLRWTTDMLREEDKIGSAVGNYLRPTESWIDQTFPENDDSVRSFMQTDRGVNLLSALLVKMDMATMAYSLEARSPLMDHVLGEFCATLPTKMLVRGGVCKAVLRDAYTGLVPNEVISGAKRGFEIPLNEWLHGPMRGMLNDIVGAENSHLQHYLDRNFIRAVIDGRLLQDRNWSYVAYGFLVLELWLRRNSGSGAG